MSSFHVRTLSAAILLAVVVGAFADEPEDRILRAQVDPLLEAGQFQQAERWLRGQVTDPAAPVTSPAATLLEIVRRTRLDFPWTQDQILAQIRESVPDATVDDLARWVAAGDLQQRSIDGEPRYFSRAASNLFRFNAEARQRRKSPPSASGGFDLTAEAERLVRLAETSSGPEISPIRHTVRYELKVKAGNPRLQPGAHVRAWLPFPQEYRQQRDVRLIKSSPPVTSISSNGSPHRTAYFEQTLADPPEPPRFVVEFDFVTSAYSPKLDPARVSQRQGTGNEVKPFLEERPPHIVMTPKVRQLAQQIVGHETNPLEKARKVFHWVSSHVPWCAEMEYCIIPNLSAKGLAARRGDCGVQGITFITLCRAVGVPARWQSGWQTQPGDWNMHDWSEFYVEPWGWLPADASYGVQDHSDPRVRDFFCGHMDPYRLIVNLDYGRPLEPGKTSFRSEPNDFQRGEIEIDGHNLYFDEWDWDFQVTSAPQ